MSACFDAGWASTASATRALRDWPPLLCAASFNFAGKQFALRVPAAGPAGGPAMRRSQTADPSDELSVMVVRMRQELKAVGRERDAFIAHINAVHERLATDRSKYPSASCAGILKLTLQETVRERDLLRGHVDELHRQLAEQAFEAAAAKVENARRSASPRPPKQLSQHDREEAQKRIRQSIEKSKKANVEQAIEEAQRKELAALVAGRKWARKLPGATLEERCAHWGHLQPDSLECSARTVGWDPPCLPQLDLGGCGLSAHPPHVLHTDHSHRCSHRPFTPVFTRSGSNRCT